MFVQQPQSKIWAPQAEPLSLEKFMKKPLTQVPGIPDHRIIYEEDYIRNSAKVLIGFIMEQGLHRLDEFVLLSVLNGAGYPGYSIFAPEFYDHHKGLICSSMQLDTYGDEQHPGNEVKVLLAPGDEVIGKHTFIFDDVFDTARSIEHAVYTTLKKGALTVSLITLLQKTSTQLSSRLLDSVQSIYQLLPSVAPEIFLFGCGLDLKKKHRLYPHISGILKKDFLALETQVIS